MTAFDLSQALSTVIPGRAAKLREPGIHSPCVRYSAKRGERHA